MKCPLCNKKWEALIEIIIGDSGAPHVCDSCHADAALGRAVRRMPKTGSHLWHHRDNTWGFYDGTGHKKGTCDEPTPEAALASAGLMEVEK